MGTSFSPTWPWWPIVLPVHASPQSTSPGSWVWLVSWCCWGPWHNRDEGGLPPNKNVPDFFQQRFKPKPTGISLKRWNSLKSSLWLKTAKTMKMNACNLALKLNSHTTRNQSGLIMIPKPLGRFLHGFECVPFDLSGEGLQGSLQRCHPHCEPGSLGPILHPK